MISDTKSVTKVSTSVSFWPHANVWR